MFVRRENSRRLFTSLGFVILLTHFSSCASKETSSEGPQQAISDAALLDSSDVASTDVSDANVFSDLEKPKDVEGMEVTAVGSTSQEDNSGAAFYQPIGGESLGRVAYTLFGKVSYSKQLLKKNPDLSGVKNLTAEHRVYFDLEKTRPQPTYLTKDLLKRYPAELGKRLEAVGAEKGMQKSSVTVGSGDTLQEISKKLYGTTRYWPEIFLINQDKVRDYDRISTGMTLAVFDHASVAVPPPAPEKPQGQPVSVPVIAPVGAILAPIPSEKPVAVPPKPVTTQPVAEVRAIDPIPEMAAPVEAPVAVTPVPKAPEKEVKFEEGASNSQTMRRILYAVLVLGIAGAAFYFTRKKRKPKFDMLDMTAAETAARPKLGGLDEGQKHTAG